MSSWNRLGFCWRGCVVMEIKSRSWLSVYFEACAQAGSKGPDGGAKFLPWNLSPKRLSELQAPMPVNTTANS